MILAGKYPMPVIRSIAIGVTTCFFAVSFHAPYPGSIFAVGLLLLLAFQVSKVLADHPEILFVKQLWTCKGRGLNFFAIPIVVSMAMAIRYRYAEKMPLVPVSISPFVLVSVMIGTTEEILFRGIIQGEAMRSKPALAVLIGAISFAGYKALLFVWPSRLNEINLPLLFVLTLLVGILLGSSRKISGSVWPAIIAHSLFDLLVYAETTKAPWWVW